MAMFMTDDGRPPVPSAAAWLGGLGLVPFVGLSLAAALLSGAWKASAIQALLGYGALILSFLGGIHWGAEMVRPIARTGDNLDARILTISVIPSLAGWAALLLDPRSGLGLLTAGFIGHLLLDIRAAQKGLVPRWYPTLRKPLTMIVAAALIVALLRF